MSRAKSLRRSAGVARIISTAAATGIASDLTLAPKNGAIYGREKAAREDLA
jgi:hypothetical protein